MEIDSNKSSFFNHKSVMVDQIIYSINNFPQQLDKEFVGIDATLGGGGHSFELLNKFPNLEMIGLDQDPYCLLYTSPSPRDPWKSRMPSSA